MIPKDKIETVVKIFLMIPLINIVATIFTPYFPGGTLNPGVVRGIFLTLFCLWFLISKNHFNAITKSSYVFLFYLLILCFLSSSILTSLYIYNKVFIASMFLPLAIYFLNTEDKFLILLRICILALGILEINFFLSNILGIGIATYKDESVLFGEAGVNITKDIVIFIVILPFYLKYEKHNTLKIIGSFLLALGVIIVILGMKRSAILALSAGFFIYSLLTPYKTRILRLTPFIVAFVLLSGPYYIPIIEKRFKARQERVSMTYNQLSSSEEEGRLLEVQFTIQQTFGDSFEKMFIGYDLFLKKQFQGHKRMLHIDYMNMLGGAGVFGLTLFLYIYWCIWHYARKIKKTSQPSLAKNEVYAVICCLLGVQAFMSFGGTMQGLDLRGTILLLLGSFLALGLQELKKENVVYES